MSSLLATQQALQWLWSYTLEMQPLWWSGIQWLTPWPRAAPAPRAAPLLWRPGARTRAPAGRAWAHSGAAVAASADARAPRRPVMPTLPRRPAAGDAAPPPAAASDAGPSVAATSRDVAAETHFRHVRRHLAAKHAALGGHVTPQDTRDVLDTLATCRPTPATYAALRALRRDVAAQWLPTCADDAHRIELLVHAGDDTRAAELLETLLLRHAAELIPFQAASLGAAPRRLSRTEPLWPVYCAVRAVLGAWSEAAAQPRATRAEREALALRCAALLLRAPLMLALLQPSCPEAIRAAYSLLAQLALPREWVQRVLDDPGRRASERVHLAGTLALAHANRGAPHTAALLVQAILDAGLAPPEAVVRRVVRVLAPTQQAVLVAPLVGWLETHGTSAASRHVVLRYHAERGDMRALEAAYARMPPDAAAFARACLVCAASRGDVAAVRRALPQPRDAADALLQLRACVRSGDVARAREVFTQATSAYASEPLYREMLRLTARLGDATETMHIVAQLEGAGLRLSTTALAYIVQALGRARLPERAAALMAHYAARGTPLRRRVYVALMDAYLRVDHAPAVLGLFRYLERSADPALRVDTGVYNMLLKAHVQRGTPVRDVLRLLLGMKARGLTPDERSYALAMQSACDAQRLTLADELLELGQRALPGGASVAMYTVLMDAYLRRDEQRRARALLDQAQARGLEPSHVTMGVLIRAYSRGAEGSVRIAEDLALRLVTRERGARAPRRGGAAPALLLDDVLVPLIDAHGKRGDVGGAERVFGQLLAAGYTVSVSAYTALMNAYRSAGDVASVLRVWNELCDVYVPKIRAQASAADALASPTRPPELGAYQRTMLCMPLSIVLDTVSRAGLHDDVVDVWARALSDGLALDAHNWNHLCAALAAAGLVPEALHILEHVLVEPTPTAYRRAAEPLDAHLEARAVAHRADAEAFARDPLGPPTPPSATAAPAPRAPPNRRPAQHVRADDADAPTTEAATHERLTHAESVWFPFARTLRAVDDALNAHRAESAAWLRDAPAAARRCALHAPDS